MLGTVAGRPRGDDGRARRRLHRRRHRAAARGATRKSEFRARFEAKGRYRPYLAAIPTHVITAPLPAFRGLQVPARLSLAAATLGVLDAGGAAPLPARRRSAGRLARGRSCSSRDRTPSRAARSVGLARAARRALRAAAAGERESDRSHTHALRAWTSPPVEAAAGQSSTRA